MLALLLAPLIAAFLWTPPGDSRVPDRVELADGAKLEGRVLYEDAETVLVRVGSRVRELKRADVAKLTSRAAAHREAIERWLALGPIDYRGMLDLAAYCQRNDLEEERRLLALTVLLGDPNQADAHEILGHEKTKQGWLAREGGRRVEWSKLLVAHADFGTPWELESTHFRVRTNLPLREALIAAFDLECHYHAFLKLFGPGLRLLEVTEPVYANLHADAKSYPEIGDGRRAYFSRALRALVVNASGGIDVPLLVHEATHALLFATADATRSGKSDIPAWLDEGLAEYMAVGMDGGPARLVFTPDALYRAHFQTFAKASPPYDLARLLTFDSTDFLASSRADLKYAEAYALVHFLMHVDNGKYRSKFVDFVASCYRGQASQSHFKDAIGVREAQLDQEWRRYAKALAGS